MSDSAKQRRRRCSKFGRRTDVSHSLSKQFTISRVKNVSGLSSGVQANKFREMSAIGGDFITRDSGLLKMPAELVLLSDMIMSDGMECRNNN